MPHDPQSSTSAVEPTDNETHNPLEPDAGDAKDMGSKDGVQAQQGLSDIPTPSNDQQKKGWFKRRWRRLKNWTLGKKGPPRYVSDEPDPYGLPTVCSVVVTLLSAFDEMPWCFGRTKLARLV